MLEELKVFVQQSLQLSARALPACLFFAQALGPAGIARIDISKVGGQQHDAEKMTNTSEESTKPWASALSPPTALCHQRPPPRMCRSPNILKIVHSSQRPHRTRSGKCSRAFSILPTFIFSAPTPTDSFSVSTFSACLIDPNPHAMLQQGDDRKRSSNKEKKEISSRARQTLSISLRQRQRTPRFVKDPDPSRQSASYM